MERKYTAFISYRHKPLDIQVAEKLHTMIERYRIPKALRKDGRKHLGLVFRDRDELPLSNNLTEDIYDALDHSEFLIVICTPDTPKSLWCQREIQYFIDHHGRDRILTVLAAGTPEESIPEIITTIRGEDNETVVGHLEPLCAYLVDESERKVLKNLKEEFLRLVAAILNCPYDNLKQRQKRYRARRRAAVIAAVTAVLLTIFALLIQWNLDVSQKNKEISSLNDQILEQLRQTQLNESQALALLSQSKLSSGLRADAARNAADALIGDRPYYAPAEAALTDAVHAYDGDKYYYAAKLQLDTHVEMVVLSRDGRYAVAMDSNQNGTCVDLATGQPLWENLPISMDWPSSQITQDGNTLLTLTSGYLNTYDLATGMLLNSLEHTHADAQALSANGTTLVLGYKPKHFAPQMTVEVLDAASGEIRHSFQRDIPYDEILFSQDDRYCLLLPKDNEDAPVIIDCQEGTLSETLLVGDVVAACSVPGTGFAFLTLDVQGDYAYEILSTEAQHLRYHPAGSQFASQVCYLLADDRWIYAIREDGGIQIVSQRAGVMFDDAFVDENILLGNHPLYVRYHPLAFFDENADLVVVNQEDAIHRLHFSKEAWSGASLGPLHYYEVPEETPVQLCRADVYGETMEYQKAFVNPNGSSAICLASKEDDSFLVFLRYAPKQAEDLSHLVPGGCTEENTRAYLQQAYMTHRPSFVKFDEGAQTLSWAQEDGTAKTVESPYTVNDPFGSRVYYGSSGWIAVFSWKQPDTPDSADGFALYKIREDRWSWMDLPENQENFSAACVGNRNPWLATASETGHVLQVTDLETGESVATLELHSGDISDMAFVCDDRFLLAVEMLEQAVILVDTSNWQVVNKYKTTLTEYSYAGEYACAALNEEGTRLYIGNLLALQQGMIIDTETWTLLANVPYMACYDSKTERVICMDPVAGKLIAYPTPTTEELITMAG